MVNSKDNRELFSRNYRSDSCLWKFDVLKTRIFVLEASLLGQIFVFRNKISADSSSTETLHCLNRNLELIM